MGPDEPALRSTLYYIACGTRGLEFLTRALPGETPRKTPGKNLYAADLSLIRRRYAADMFRYATEFRVIQGDSILPTKDPW